jgi:hypothetical protein
MKVTRSKVIQVPLTPYNVQPCLVDGESVYDVILAASQRARELKREGHPLFRTQALKDIAYGRCGVQEYIKKSNDEVKERRRKAKLERARYDKNHNHSNQPS